MLLGLIMVRTTGACFSLMALAFNQIGFFLVVNYMISSLKISLEREREMARTDYLTQVANSRYFAEIASNEIKRASRYLHPFTVAYLDIDDFKSVNDRWGHSTGDQLLALVADTVRSNIRATDSIARLGGDEFVLLLPETGYSAASVVIQKVHQSLRAAMERKGWPVTFSIGVLTCMDAPGTVENMLEMADELMYSVKNNWKNAIGYSVHGN
jgi:diguanylate cyclase (GGDEF)-like protein